MPTKTITIPREEYRDLKNIRARFEEVRHLLMIAEMPTEDSSLYKPSFIRKLKRAQREAAAGKLYDFPHGL